jgi:CubicO group peptidase (beta-lactamase class C family)
LDPLAALDEAAERSEFSGALLVARDGAPLLEKAYGFADRANGTRNAVDTRLGIGSMNKMFTAVAILQLVDRNAVRLDAPLREYLRDYPNEDLAARGTIRHLLSHTGGTGDIFTPAYASARAVTRDPEDFIKLFGARGACLGAAGTRP